MKESITPEEFRELIGEEIFQEFVESVRYQRECDGKKGGRQIHLLSMDQIKGSESSKKEDINGTLNCELRKILVAQFEDQFKDKHQLEEKLKEFSKPYVGKFVYIAPDKYDWEKKKKEIMEEHKKGKSSELIGRIYGRSASNIRMVISREKTATETRR